MNGDPINNKLNQLDDARKDTEGRIAQSQDILDSVDNKIADFKRRQQQRLQSDVRVTDAVTKTISTANEEPQYVEINGHKISPITAAWHGDKLCVEISEERLAELKPVLSQQKLTVKLADQTWEGWISMQLSYGYFEIRKVA